MERNSFLIVAKEMLANKRISATAKLLYAQLLDHRNKRTGECYPQQTTLARELGVSRWTVMRKLEQLKTAGLVTPKRTQRGNRYEFSKLQSATSQVAKCDFPKLQNGASGAPYPLYEPYLKEPGGVRSAPAASSPNKKPSNAPLPPRKSAQSEVLEAYYREERRKAAKA